MTALMICLSCELSAEKGEHDYNGTNFVLILVYMSISKL